MPFNSQHTADRFIGAVKQAIINHELGSVYPYLPGVAGKADRPYCSMGHGSDACGLNTEREYANSWHIGHSRRYRCATTGLTRRERTEIEASSDALFTGQALHQEGRGFVQSLTKDPVKLTEHLRLLEKIPVDGTP